MKVQLPKSMLEPSYQEFSRFFISFLTKLRFAIPALYKLYNAHTDADTTMSSISSAHSSDFSATSSGGVKTVPSYAQSGAGILRLFESFGPV